MVVRPLGEPGEEKETKRIAPILVLAGLCWYVIALNRPDAREISGAGTGMMLPKSGDSTYVIQVTADSNGTIDPDGTVMVLAGADRAITITPRPGFRIDTILVDGMVYDPFRLPPVGEKKTTVPPSSKEPYTYNFENVRTNHSLRAAFVLDEQTYTITVISEKGGIIRGVNSERPNIIIDQPDPAGCEETATDHVSAEFHESKYFAVIPAQGYDVDSIIVDGVKFERRWNGLGLDQYVWPIYTFDKIESDHLLRATFTKESH